MNGSPRPDLAITLRLMPEGDLPIFDEVQARYLPRVLAQESVTPYIAMLGDEPVGYARSYVALGSGGGWWEDETDPGVRGIDQ